MTENSHYCFAPNVIYSVDLSILSVSFANAAVRAALNRSLMHRSCAVAACRTGNQFFICQLQRLTVYSIHQPVWFDLRKITSRQQPSAGKVTSGSRNVTARGCCWCPAPSGRPQANIHESVRGLASLAVLSC